MRELPAAYGLLGHAGEEVAVRSITSLIDSGLPFPTFLKIDVEGAEALVLDGASRVLAAAQARDELPTMLVSVHGEGMYRSCLTLMRELGYRVLHSKGISRFLAGGVEWEGDPDLLAVPPQRRAEMSAIRSTPWFAEATSGS